MCADTFDEMCPEINDGIEDINVASTLNGTI